MGLADFASLRGGGVRGAVEIKKEELALYLKFPYFGKKETDN